MPPTMQAVQPARTKQGRANKQFEVVHAGPIKLYFSHFHLIGLESGKTKTAVCAPVMPAMGSTMKAIGPQHNMHTHREYLESDKSKWRTFHSSNQRSRRGQYQEAAHGYDCLQRPARLQRDFFVGQHPQQCDFLVGPRPNLL